MEYYTIEEELGTGYRLITPNGDISISAETINSIFEEVTQTFNEKLTNEMKLIPVIEFIIKEYLEVIQFFPVKL